MTEYSFLMNRCINIFIFINKLNYINVIEVSICCPPRDKVMCPSAYELDLELKI